MMKKNSKGKVLRSSLIGLIVAAMMVSFLPTPRGQVSGYEASHIERLENAPKLDLQDYLDQSVMFQLPASIKDDENISVIITVGEATLMDAYEATDKALSFTDYALNSQEAAALRAKIAEQKADVLAQLDRQGISYVPGRDYDTLLSGFEIEILAKDFNATCQSLKKGQGIVVSEVYKKTDTQLVENNVTVYDTGIFDTSGCQYDGSGMVVAVLDTGLDSNHSAFSVENFTSDTLGMTYEDVAAVVGKTTANKQFGGLTVDDVYINEKVPFGFDYADNDPDVYSTHNNHGTHVSGVIVGKDDIITGAAPNAQLVSMKIFSDVMDTARATWILSALEDCVVLGVDVINMSLGTACGFSRESDEEVMNGVYDKIREAGITVMAAASNSYNSSYGSEKNGNLPLTSNPDTSTVGSPSTYQGVMSVASISGEETPYLLYNNSIIYFTEANSSAAEELDFVETLLGDKKELEIEYVLIPGVGRSADYTGMDVTGKIVLVRRGDNTFEEKAMIAESKGAAGIIIYNNVSGDIKMNVGDAKLAVCSISQDDGKVLAEANSGVLKLSVEQASGPFISDFSSWGPTPSLGIKPEITGHGGNILSSVTGGGYDRLSGTSMACPNLAGLALLLRQYVTENFPSIANDNVKVSAMVNKLLMSTADIALNTNGSPYAVRKQGAGLANLFAALDTKAYITTYDKDGKEMDTAKLELGDDPGKKGVYTMSFSVENFGDKQLSYELGYYVMTEGVSDTKTSGGLTTVTEEAYILEGATLSIDEVSGGTLSDKKLTVEAGKSAKVTVTITLSDADKAYLNKSFENGMYVEGYITLDAVSGTDIGLNVPYLAFYGDWTLAPMFDKEYYETHADELDDGISVEDKTMADAYASRPIGGVYDDYVSFLGTYYFLQDPEDIQISADKDHISLSNQEGTIHSLRFVWAGLLRNASKVDITITNAVTGEQIFETTDTDVRKSYGDGGSIYPANIEVEFDTTEHNLANNTQYVVCLEAYMDYEDGGFDTNKRNVFEFPLTIDFEAPTITDVEYYYEYDKTLKKNRLYAKVGIYDNHYTMCSQLGYVTMEADEEGNDAAALKSFDQFMTPVYSQRNSTTYVTYELTDQIFEIKEKATNKNSFIISCYDYALNLATYEIGLPDDFTDFYLDGLDEGLTMSPNEVYSLEPLVYPATEWGELLEITSSRSSVVRVVNNKLVAGAPGNANVKVRDAATNQSVTFKVTVLDEEDDGYRRYDKPVADVFTLTGYKTLKAYYMIDSEDKLIGDTGDTRFFNGDYSLSMYPSETVSLNYNLDAFFPNDTKVVYETSNENIVKVTDGGVITAEAEGFASVTIKVMMDDKSTYYSETVSVEVKDPYVTNGASLSHYYGKGGVVMIPEDLSLREIGNFSFSNFEYILKTEEELAFDDAETSKQWYIGDNTVTKVVIPEGVKKIGSYAFANLTALEEVVFPSTLQEIDYGAFYGCSSLQKISFSSENNLKIINQNAFEKCDLQDTLDLSAACVISDYAFAGNTDLEGLVTSESLLSIGQYAFAGCKSLKDVTITATKVKYGIYAFTDCEALTTFYVNASVLPEGMFYECAGLESVKIGPDVNDIGPFAFLDTKLSSFEVVSGNKAFKAQTADYILSADGKIIIAVAPSVEGNFNSSNIGGADVNVVGKGGFSHNTKITAVNLPNVTEVGEYGFGSSKNIASITLGTLSKIGEYAFFETAISTHPAITTETQIGKYAFSHSALTTVTIPDGMTVPEGAFSECLVLESVTIGNDVTLEDFAFSTDKDNVFKVMNFDEDGEKYFYYVFEHSLKTVTIGDNAVMGKNAFSGAASLETVNLGANAQIGYMAFYNNCSLKNIDLSKATSIDDYAFSGDVYYICLDDSMTVGAIDSNGFYRYTYHAPQILKADLSAATKIGAYAFAYCRQMTDVVLGSQITELPEYAFAGCNALVNINLEGITKIGDYAFIENKSLVSVNSSAAETIGEYAFVYCDNLTQVTLGEAVTDIGEGAFSYCKKLSSVAGLGYCDNFDSYAFAHTALTDIDLTGAVTIGDFVFLKETKTPITVKLGSELTSVGDNPFTMCVVPPFCMEETQEFNGKTIVNKIYTYDISDSVRIINGSLYSDVPSGMELITYTGSENNQMIIPEGAVRIGAYAFVCTDVEMVTIPYSVTAIGHKAFFDCNKLDTVSFGSYKAPILEEEFDPSYYDTMDHIPGTGDFGTYTDYDGNEVWINGTGLIPYYMWNATDGQYSNVFYGANFVDYVGYVENKLTMIRPVNGKYYDSYILEQYFDRNFDGAAGADDVTLVAIKAINAIPERVSYSDKPLVEAARAAYNKIATIEQQALVTNYSVLVTAEQRIISLTPTQEVQEEETTKESMTWLAWLVIGLGVAGVAAAVIIETRKTQKKRRAEAAVEADISTEDPKQ